MAGSQVGVLAERESGLEALLQRVEPERIQPPGLGGRPRRLRQTQQRRPAPERERVGDRVCGSPRIAGAERAACGRKQLLELHGVHDRSFERVPVGGEPNRVWPQRPAQPGHVVLHGVSRRTRKIAAPQRLDQRVRGDDTTRSQGQARHERLPLGARHVHRLPAYDHLERPQEPNLELSHTACPPLSRAVWHAGLRGARLRYAAPVSAGSAVGVPAPGASLAPCRPSRRQRRATGWQLHGSAGTHRYRHDAGDRIRTELGRCCRSPTGCPHAASRW